MRSYFTNITALNACLTKLNEEADLDDIGLEYQRQIKKALREREGKLALIEKKYGNN